jgi:hypothetical protein
LKHKCELFKKIWTWNRFKTLAVNQETTLISICCLFSCFFANSAFYLYLTKQTKYERIEFWQVFDSHYKWKKIKGLYLNTSLNLFYG